MLWRTMSFDQVAEAHQLMMDNQHLGKIAILVGADSEGSARLRTARGRFGRRSGCLMAGVVNIPWYSTVFRGDQFEEGPEGDRADLPALRGDRLRGMRSNDDRYRFWQFSHWENKGDFEAYWYGPSSTNGGPTTRAGTRCRSSTVVRPRDRRRAGAQQGQR